MDSNIYHRKWLFASYEPMQAKPCREPVMKDKQSVANHLWGKYFFLYSKIIEYICTMQVNT
jgi:hypothetical protein